MPDAACLTCQRLAPILGDAGFLGYPSIEEGTVRGKQAAEYAGMPTFGALYRVLASVGLVTSDLTHYHAFLEEHRGHKMYLSLDPDNEDDVPSVFSWDPERDRTVPDRVTLQSTLPAGHANGHVGYQCVSCADAQRTSPRDRLLVFQPYRLEAGTARVVADALSAPELEGPWAYGLTGAIDTFSDFLCTLPAFLRAHGDHGIEVAFERSPE